jgi:voltage-gated potassium channel
MKQKPRLKDRVYEIVFESDTRLGKLFDVSLLILITISVLTVILESVPTLQQHYNSLFFTIEWIVTILFTLEYILRLIIVRRRLGYVFSFFGIIDLLSILPAYLSLILPGSQYLLAIRVLRLIRIFRIFKLTNYVRESHFILIALRNSRFKITVFLTSLMLLVVIMGALMYVIEGSSNKGFDSIPRSIYWAIITLTTVGYGDITPETPFGQMIASVVMIMGYAIIAVPTGIVTAAITSMDKQKHSNQVCPHCMAEGHQEIAIHCYRCGQMLNPQNNYPA